MVSTGWNVSDLIAAGHWVTGSDGFTASMIFLLTAPYFVLGAGAFIYFRYLRPMWQDNTGPRQDEDDGAVSVETEKGALQ